MALITREIDLVSASNFSIELDLGNSIYSADGIFRECQGLHHSQEAIEFCEVTNSTWGTAKNKGQVVRTKLPGNAKSGNVTLRRGLFKSMAIWDWLEEVREGEWAKKRQDCTLTFRDCNSITAVRLKLIAAWPTSYRIGDVKADASEIAIEELEIAFEGFQRIKAGGAMDIAKSAGRNAVYG